MVEAPEDYERLKRFIGMMAEPVLGVLPTSDIHPLRVLKDIEHRSRTQAKAGLKMAVNDIVEMTETWSVDQVVTWDEKLASAGAATLTEARIRFSKRLKAILKRGTIRSEFEYYLVRNAAENRGTDAAHMWQLLSVYEAGLSANG